MPDRGPRSDRACRAPRHCKLTSRSPQGNDRLPHPAPWCSSLRSPLPRDKSSQHHTASRCPSRGSRTDRKNKVSQRSHRSRSSCLLASCCSTNPQGTPTRRRRTRRTPRDPRRKDPRASLPHTYVNRRPNTIRSPRAARGTPRDPRSAYQGARPTGTSPHRASRRPHHRAPAAAPRSTSRPDRDRCTAPWAHLRSGLPDRLAQDPESCSCPNELPRTPPTPHTSTPSRRS